MKVNVSDGGGGVLLVEPVGDIDGKTAPGHIRHDQPVAGKRAGKALRPGNGVAYFDRSVGCAFT